MKTEIKISSNYGFDHNWTLEVNTKTGIRSFYLGQDIKFIRRVLGMEPDYLIEQIGTRDISNGSVGNRKLARFICNELGINIRTVGEIESWGLCAE
jgi:hypothetical protein